MFGRDKSTRVEREKDGLGPARIIRRIFGVLLTVVLGLVIALAGIVFLLCKGPSQSARDLTVTTFLESGSLKFVPHLFLSNEEISEIVNKTAMQSMDTSVLDASLVDASQTGEEAAALDMNAIEIKEILGRTYYAKLMIVNDPSRVKIGGSVPFGDSWNLDEIVTGNGCIAGVNGGLYANITGTGGAPRGVVVKDHEILCMDIYDEEGLYLIGFDDTNLLQIIDIHEMGEEEIRATVADRHIRDAICFQDEASDANNHFVPLVINGVPRELGGLGSGANPRTVVGQRADGAVLLLVTDWRGASGHLGATASDLINIMVENGAVNAANLDGGSSSSMWYDGKYEMTSVTLMYANGSWLMPTAVVVEAR